MVMAGFSWNQSDSVGFGWGSLTWKDKPKSAQHWPNKQCGITNWVNIRKSK